MYMRYLFLGLFISLSLSLPAQLQKTLHQSFSVPDTVRIITFEINGEYVVEPWPGNVVMSETRISLYNANRSLFAYMLQNQRYELEGIVGTDSLRLASIVMERPDIQTSAGKVTELVDVRVFVPQVFIKAGEHTWQRKEEEHPAEETESQSSNKKGQGSSAHY